MSVADLFADGEIVIELLRINRNRALLGVDAPPSLQVWRGTVAKGDGDRDRDRLNLAEHRVDSSRIKRV